LSFVWNATGGIGTIDASGVLNASTQVGLGLVTATTGSATGTAIVEIVPDVLATVALQPAAASLEAGSNLALHAQAVDRYGNAIPNVPLTWSVTGGVGTVSSSGAFTASTRVGAGSVIAMYATGMTGRQDLTIVPATPARVDIGLTSTTLAVDSNSVIVATVRD